MKRPAKRRDRRRSEEGVVMLIVMMILLTATTMASISLSATQFELRSAGFSRSALQTQYVSEAAMATTMTWVDVTSLDNGIVNHLDKWNGLGGPKVEHFGEPRLTPGNSPDATRTQWVQQAELAAVTLPPITMPGQSDDPVGTFGPRVAYNPGAEDSTNLLPDYVVDMYDCRRLRGTGSPGSRVNTGGSGAIREMQLYCVITSRGRSFVPGGASKIWQTGAGNYSVNRFATAHDSRGTIVTPPIVIQ
jgi:hypothetical protein